MKKIFTFPNIQAVLFLVLSIAETVVMVLFKPLPVGIIVVMQIFSLLAIVLIRFAYKIALLDNIWHGLWNRKNWSRENDEPSDLAVGITKATGYLVLLAFSIVLFFYLG